MHPTICIIDSFRTGERLSFKTYARVSRSLRHRTTTFDIFIVQFIEY